MWLKTIIVILFVSLVISLFTSFGFLIKDREVSGQRPRRAWNALSIRLVLTSLLIGFLIYGVFTGKLASNAPWDARYADKLPAKSPSGQ